MNVLLLTCSTGEGHNACAKALQESFAVNGDACDIRDALNFISPRASRLISGGHVFIYRRAPGVFRRGYRFAETHTSTFREASLFSRYFAKGAADLYEQIKLGSYDAVICTHPFAALMLHRVQKQWHLPILTAIVATDYTCSPGVKDAVMDYYFIPDQTLTEEFTSAGIPAERIVPSGIPIRQFFYNKTPAPTARKSLGIAPNRKHLVMMCGSMGCGPIKTLTNLLTREMPDAFDLTVICGTNKTRRQQLTRCFGHRDNLHILGYVKDMSLMLDSADLYLTKPGGISVTEAAAKNTPMVFIDAVDGCEAHNRRFFVDLGGAIDLRCTKDAPTLCRSLLQNPALSHKMAQQLHSIAEANAAAIIMKTMHEASECAMQKGG